MDGAASASGQISIGQEFFQLHAYYTLLLSTMEKNPAKINFVVVRFRVTCEKNADKV